MREIQNNNFALGTEIAAGLVGRNTNHANFSREKIQNKLCAIGTEIASVWAKIKSAASINHAK